QVVPVDVAPQVLLRPVRDRVDLPDAARLVSFEFPCRGPGRRLLTTDPGDPSFDALERVVERVHLSRAAAAIDRPRLVGARGIEHLDTDSEPVFEALQRLEGLS